MKENMDRNETILKLREKGWTYALIAKYFGLSIGRVRQICMKDIIRENERLRYGDMAELTVRVRNVLFRGGIKSKKDFIDMLESEDGVIVRGVGTKAIKEIEDFVGFSVLTEKKNIHRAYGKTEWISKMTILKKA